MKFNNYLLNQNSSYFYSIKRAGCSQFNPEMNVKALMWDLSFEHDLNKKMDLKKEIKEKQVKSDCPKRKSSDACDTFYTKMKELINPEGKSTFLSILDELKETNYKSYWTRQLGEVPDPVPGLPIGMDPRTTTFGGISERDSITAGELINPRKALEEELEERKGHENYVTSHHGYNAGEQVNRKYDNPMLNKELFWGKRTWQKRDGSRMKKVLQWFDQSKVSTTSKSLAINRALYRHEVGKPYSPNRYIDTLPKGFTFGRSTFGEGYGVAELLTTSSCNNDKNQLADCLSYINSLRLKLSQKDPPFPFYEFMQEFKHIDPESCGCLPLEEVYKVCEEYNLTINKELMEPLLKWTNMLQPDYKANYIGFIRLINSKLQFPSIAPFEDIPKESLFFETSYQGFTKDAGKKDAKDQQRPAGQSTLMPNKLYPLIVDTKVDESYLFGETNVDSLIRPSIFTQYGVSHRDLFWPRSKEFIKGLFERIEVEIPDEVFELLWEEGRSRDGAGDRVSVETFRNLLDELTSARLAQMSL